jgi:hypothetical protein
VQQAKEPDMGKMIQDGVRPSPPLISQIDRFVPDQAFGIGETSPHHTNA